MIPKQEKWNHSNGHCNHCNEFFFIFSISIPVHLILYNIDKPSKYLITLTAALRRPSTENSSLMPLYVPAPRVWESVHFKLKGRKCHLIRFIIHPIVLLPRDWSKRRMWLNVSQLKLGDIREYHRGDTPQLSNLTFTATSLRFKLNSRWKRVLWLLQEKGNLYLFIKSY